MEHANRIRKPLGKGVILLITFVVAGTAAGQLSVRYSSAEVPEAAKQQVLETYDKLPLSFEVNQGQVDGRVKFLSRGGSHILFLTPTEVVLALLKPRAKSPSPSHEAAAKTKAAEKTGSVVLRMQLIGANPAPQMKGFDELPGRSNYFIGNDPKKWHRNVPQYAKVKYHEVYPGIGLIYYGSERQLEYDFVVAPGADPRQIRLRFKGADKLSLDAQGNLILHVAQSKLIQRAPVIYQETDGARQAVSGGYVLQGAHLIGFEVGPYDSLRPLVIDPVVLSYSTYLGGAGLGFAGQDAGMAIAVDSAGSAYVTGKTGSIEFPTTAETFQAASAGSFDVFVSKLSADGSSLVYSTYLGGSGFDTGQGIAVDVAGNAYVTGLTLSSINFPTTMGAFQTTFGGGDFPGDAFVTKLTPDGAGLFYSTYLGGTAGDQGNAIALDGMGNAYVTGTTSSDDFPTTGGAFETTFPGGSVNVFDAFVTKLSADGSSLVYSTYLGGFAGGGFDGGFGIGVDAADNAYVTGQSNSTDFPTTAGAFRPTFFSGAEAFVTKLNDTGSALVYSTYLGGISFDAGNAIAVDSVGNAYVTGTTRSDDFPTTMGAFQTTFGGGGFPGGDAFVTKLSADGSSLVYSTYLGGSGSENVGDFTGSIAVDSAGNAYVTGSTQSTDFPTASPLQPSRGGGFDAFVTKLSADGSSLVYSTYLGGSGDETFLFPERAGIAVDAAGSAYVTASTGSSDFPTASPLQPSLGGDFDAFVAKIAQDEEDDDDDGDDDDDDDDDGGGEDDDD